MCTEIPKEIEGPRPNPTMTETQANRTRMEIHKEIEEIAKRNREINALVQTLEHKIDIDGLDFTTARFIEDCVESRGHLSHEGAWLDNAGLVDNLYYCEQHTGCCEDDFYGTLYFATDIPGTFIAINFSM